MSGLTVIIPYLPGTPTEHLEETLASVLEYRSEGVEILVVNAGRYSDSYSIEEEGVRFLAADEGLELAQYINLGVFAATTPIVQTLLCGVAVTEGWASTALKRFESPKIGVVIPRVVERVGEKGEISHAGWIYRRDGRILPAVEVERLPALARPAPCRYGAFFRRQPLVDLGGMEPFALDFACIDAVLMLDALGFGAAAEPASRLVLDGTAAVTTEPGTFLMYEEALFRRWTDRGGRGKNLRLYRKRSFFEWLAAIFRGQGGLWSKAREKGRALGDENAKREKLLDAKRAMVARKTGGAEGRAQ